MSGRNSISSVLVAFSVALAACTDPTEVGSPEVQIRAARPVSPPSSGITVVALGTLPHSRTIPGDGVALALNNGATRAATRAAGQTAYQTTINYPFTWTSSSGMAPLDIAEAGNAVPYGVSDAGLITGDFSNSSAMRGFVVTAGGSMSFLPLPSGATRSSVRGINADGTCIVGLVFQGGLGYAALWRNNSPELIGNGDAHGVSNDCLVVAGNSGGRAVVWRWIDGTWTIETLASLDSEAHDISPNGVYVSGRRMAPDSVWHAAVWRRTSNGWEGVDMPGSTEFAFGVDNSGRAVGVAGNSPYVWTPKLDGTYTSQMLPPIARSNWGWAQAINELGQIVGRSKAREGHMPVMWTLPN